MSNFWNFVGGIFTWAQDGREDPMTYVIMLLVFAGFMLLVGAWTWVYNRVVRAVIKTHRDARRANK